MSFGCIWLTVFRWRGEYKELREYMAYRSEYSSISLIINYLYF